MGICQPLGRQTERAVLRQMALSLRRVIDTNGCHLAVNFLVQRFLDSVIGRVPMQHDGISDQYWSYRIGSTSTHGAACGVSHEDALMNVRSQFEMTVQACGKLGDWEAAGQQVGSPLGQAAALQLT